MKIKYKCVSVTPQQGEGGVECSSAILEPVPAAVEGFNGNVCGRLTIGHFTGTAFEQGKEYDVEIV